MEICIYVYIIIADVNSNLVILQVKLLNYYYYNNKFYINYFTRIINITYNNKLIILQITKLILTSPIIIYI